MHSVLVRAQNVFGFLTTVAFSVAILTALSVIVIPQNPTANIELRNVQVVKGRLHYYSPKKEEYAVIRFDLDADFTSLFNWNTKQVFVWITATYPSSNTSLKAPPSEAVIWDQIINSHSQSHPLNPFEYFQNLYSPPKKLSKGKGKKNNGAKKAEEAEVGIIKLKNAKPKYQITDITGKMAERENVTLQVGWNVQPWVGALLWTMPEGFELGRWKGVTGGTSKVFKMPSLKGKSASSETVVASGGTPKAAEASAVV